MSEPHCRISGCKFLKISARESRSTDHTTPGGRLFLVREHRAALRGVCLSALLGRLTYLARSTRRDFVSRRRLILFHPYGLPFMASPVAIFARLPLYGRDGAI
jgi:hypothetical protein